MRWTAPLLFLLASGGAAQTVEPDPTPPASYYPLAVGNEWVYTKDVRDDYGDVEDVRYFRDRAVESVAVDRVEYVVVVREEASRSVPAWFEAGRDTVRFDAGRAVVVHLEGGVETVQSCPLDAAFGSTVECAVSGGAVTAEVVRADEVVRYALDIDVAAKRFVIDGDLRPTYVAGLGFIGYADDPGGDPFIRDTLLTLAYAEIVGADGGRTEYGLEPPSSSWYVPWPRDAEADPTPPELYYPLHTGYVREQQTSFGVAGRWRQRWEVWGDSVIAGRTYAVQWTSGRVEEDIASNPNDPPTPYDWGEGTTDLLRYDSVSTQVVRLAEGGGEEPTTPPLGAAFGALVAVSDTPPALPFGREGDYVVDGGIGDHELRIGDDVVRAAAVKHFTPVPFFYRESFPLVTSYGARIGPLPLDPHDVVGRSCPGCFNRITYLRTLGPDGRVVEFGRRLATDATDRPAPPAFALAAGPSPTAGPLTLTVTLPAPADVAAEAFDVLGRRVWRTAVPLGAGRQALALDAGPWAPGLYVVRVAAGGAARTATVVRR